eukprot:TRINITY_DN3924_c0_g1_i1.p1 TRINITY_DN3924_c0_g1~~TRINITY_DN3924_c0_g1_i1.p1  ORF type:complete len:512 (-),score=236.69 TRINITY_DN3924_c0_g1_i1:32-1501(-)
MDDDLKKKLESNDPSTRAVTLSYALLDDAGLAELCGALPSGGSVVTTLYLDGNAFGSLAPLRIAAESGRLPKLTELWLGDNDCLTDACTSDVLAIVDACKALAVVALNNCEIGREALAELAAEVQARGRKISMDVSGNADVQDDEATRIQEIANSTRVMPQRGDKQKVMLEVPGGAADPSRQVSTEDLLRAKVESLELRLAQQSVGSSASTAYSASARPLYRTLRPTDIELGVKIGSGGFSKIYRGTWLGKDVAIKKLRGAMDEETARAFYKEMNLLSGLRHPNVLLLLGATEMEDKMVIVTELMMGGSLYGLLQRYKKKGLSLEPRVLRSILLDTALGMCYLHECEPPVIHRDLKSMNILLDEHGTAKVADFGLSREREDNVTMTAGLGTPHWLAPEIARRQKYDEKVDVYSFGIMIWEMLTLSVPFSELDAFALIGRLLSDDTFRPEVPENTDPDVAALMVACWHADPKQRPSFKEIIKLVKALPEN